MTALLVGTVVVVLGFASGIGVDTRTAGASAGTPQLTTAPAAPAPSTSTRAGVNYVALPAPAQPSVVAPVAAPPVSATSAAPSTVPPSAPTTSARTSTIAPVTTGPPAPTCGSGLLADLLHALLDPANGLLGLVDSILGRTSLTGGAVSSGPLDLSALFGLMGAPAEQATQPPSLLSAVTELLPKVLPSLGASAPTQSAALATSCTSAVSSTLPLLGGLG